MFSSVNTNMGAMVALQSLNRTNSEMATTQKAISTGLRVADAKDDGAAFAVAERVRSNVGALTSANQQLRGVKGTVDSTLGALKEVSSVMKDMKEVLIKLASSDVQGESRVNYKQAYNDKLTSPLPAEFKARVPLLQCNDCGRPAPGSPSPGAAR